MEYSEAAKMDIVIILQIITIGISLITLVSNAVITINENRKKNYLDLTTSYRIEVLTKTRELMSNIVTLANPMVCRNAAGNNEYIKELVKIKTDLDIILKDINEEELELKKLVGDIVGDVYNYLNNPDLEKEEYINHKLEKLLYLYSIYDSADWKFIKMQSTGKIFDNKEWLEFYEHYKNKFPNID